MMINYGQPLTFDGLIKESDHIEDNVYTGYHCDPESLRHHGGKKRPWDNEKEIDILLYGTTAWSPDKTDNLLIPSMQWRSAKRSKDLKQYFYDDLTLQFVYGHRRDIFFAPTLTGATMLDRYLTKENNMFIDSLLADQDELISIAREPHLGRRYIYDRAQEFSENASNAIDGILAGDYLKKLFMNFGAYISKSGYDFLSSLGGIVAETIDSNFDVTPGGYRKLKVKENAGLVGKVIAAAIHYHVLQRDDETSTGEVDTRPDYLKGISSRTKFCLDESAFKYLSKRIEDALTGRDMMSGNLRDGVVQYTALKHYFDDTLRREIHNELIDEDGFLSMAFSQVIKEMQRLPEAPVPTVVVNSFNTVHAVFNTVWNNFELERD